MKVVCDNCGAVYKIPKHKLVKEVNKATCRKCGHRIMIRRQEPAAPAEPESNEEATVIAEAAQVSGERHAAPPLDSPFGAPAEEPTPLPTSPMDRAAPPHPAQPQAPTPMPMPTPGHSYSHQPTPAPAPSAAATGVVMAERAHDPTGDLSVILLGAAGAGVGAIVLALGGGNFVAHFAGLFLALWGALLIALMVATGVFGRRSAWVFTSLFLSLLLSGVLSAALNPLTVKLITGEVSFSDIDSLAQRVSTAAQQAQQAQSTDGVADAQPAPAPDKETETELVPDRAEAEAEAGPEAENAPAEDDGTPQDLLDVLATEEPAPPPAPEPPPAATSSGSSSSRSSTSTTSSSSGSSSSRPSSSSSGSSSSRPTSSSSSSRPSSSSSGSSSSGSSSSSSSSSSRQPTSSSSSSSTSTGQKTIPTTVIDIQIRNNKNIKACFLAHKKSTGELPSITLRFTLEPSGSVSSASIREPAYQGTALESCLSGSIKMIDFQSFDGPAYTLNYPFRF